MDLRSLWSAVWPNLILVAIVAAIVALVAPNCRTFGVRSNPFEDLAEDRPGLAAWGFCGQMQTAGDKDGKAAQGQNVMLCKPLEREAILDIRLVRCERARAADNEAAIRTARAACLAETKAPTAE